MLPTTKKSARQVKRTLAAAKKRERRAALQVSDMIEEFNILESECCMCGDTLLIERMLGYRMMGIFRYFCPSCTNFLAEDTPIEIPPDDDALTPAAYMERMQETKVNRFDVGMPSTPPAADNTFW
jgi:hypothetical protein